MAVGAGRASVLRDQRVADRAAGAPSQHRVRSPRSRGRYGRRRGATGRRLRAAALSPQGALGTNSRAFALKRGADRRDLLRTRAARPDITQRTRLTVAGP